jgi:hypothetical protein
MAQIKKELLECLIRECICELLDQSEDVRNNPTVSNNKPKIDEIKIVIKQMVKDAFSIK